MTGETLLFQNLSGKRRFKRAHELKSIKKIKRRRHEKSRAGEEGIVT